MSNSLTQLALKKFKKNRSGLFSFWYIILCGIVAVFAYVFTPDDSSNANQMHLEIHSKKPGFTVQMLTLPSQEVSEQSFFSKLFFGKKNSATEIPIASYNITANTLDIVPYSEEGIQKLVKSYPLSSFKNSPEQYIAHKKFLWGTDKYGRDL